MPAEAAQSALGGTYAFSAPIAYRPVCGASEGAQGLQAAGLVEQAEAGFDPTEAEVGLAHQLVEVGEVAEEDLNCWICVVHG